MSNCQCVDCVTVYHGSSHRFKMPKIVKSNTSDSSLGNEGYGIYFSLTREIAMSYGKYLYSIELPRTCLVDFRDFKVCKKYLKAITDLVYKKVGISLTRYIDSSSFNSLAKCLCIGKVGIWDIGRELYMHLDLNQNWDKLAQVKKDEVARLLDGAPKKLLQAYLFQYGIPNIGVIKDLNSIQNVTRTLNP